jgi:hypothetical protein
MKILLTALGSLLLLNSCVFESPFETQAKIPVNPALLGRWESVPGGDGQASERMLVLQHSPNEYAVEYPVGEKAMFFRAFAVELAGGSFIQIQLIGTAEGPVKPEDRKFHLLKVSATADAMEMRTIDPDVLGKDHGDPAQMKAAFNEHKDDPKLFEDPEKFRKIR